LGFGTEFDYPVREAHLLAFLKSYAGALIDLRARSLFAVVHRIGRQKTHCRTSCGADELDKLAALVSVFRRIRHYFFTGDGKCLLHALTLTRYLGLYGICPTFVIGVRTSPWSAHAWVEHAGHTLDATPEKIRSFHPILWT